MQHNFANRAGSSILFGHDLQNRAALNDPNIIYETERLTFNLSILKFQNPIRNMEIPVIMADSDNCFSPGFELRQQFRIKKFPKTGSLICCPSGSGMLSNCLSNWYNLSADAPVWKSSGIMTDMRLIGIHRNVDIANPSNFNETAISEGIVQYFCR